MKLEQTEIVNTLKLLIYKENPSLLEKIDYEDENIFLEPLLFVFFNSKKNNKYSLQTLEELLQVYLLDKREIKLDNLFNYAEIAYLPKIGYFKSDVKIPFEPVYFVLNTKIELVKYPVDLITNIFTDLSGKSISKKDLDFNNYIFEKNISYLTNAFRYIKDNCNQHFQIIEQCCKKIVLFKTNPEITNSFATIKAHGMAFFNVYQDEYDEVFFVDDIAHQTGHIILTTLSFNRKNIFIIDENQNVAIIIRKEDHRTIYILFHALYTYYATFLCLDNCIHNDVFNSKQKHEALGRITFYLRKCKLDLERFQLILNYFENINNVLTIDGIEIFEMINAKFFELCEKFDFELSNLNLNNQTYNFTYSKFVQLNPI